MPKHITSAPIEGGNIRQGPNYVRMPDGSVGVAGAEGVTPFGQAPAPAVQPAAPAEVPVTPGQVPAAPAEPARELTPLEHFHPDLDPTKIKVVWDEKTGKAKILELEEAETPAEGEVDTGVDDGLPPALAGPDPSQQQQQTAPATSEVAELRTQLSQMALILQAVVQGQAQGKPLAEILGTAKPAEPTPPDPTKFDLYDSEQLADYHRQNAAYTQTMIRQGVQDALAPHLPTIQTSRQSIELEGLKQTYGKEPNFDKKSQAALQLVQANPGMPVENAYKIVSHIVGVVVPNGQPAQTQTQSSTTQNSAAPNGQPNGTANKARQTILKPEQVAEKAAQAKRLPQNSGVRGAGTPSPPANLELGDMILWLAQNASHVGN